jgi:hypothetical protein
MNDKLFTKILLSATSVWGRVAPTSGPAVGWQGRSFGLGIN